MKARLSRPRPGIMDPCPPSKAAPCRHRGTLESPPRAGAQSSLRALRSKPGSNFRNICDLQADNVFDRHHPRLGAVSVKASVITDWGKKWDEALVELVDASHD